MNPPLLIALLALGCDRPDTGAPDPGAGTGQPGDDVRRGPLPEGMELVEAAARPHDPAHRCRLLPVALDEAPYEEVDLDGDAFPDRLMLLPGSCITSTCTWRLYAGCPAGGFLRVGEVMALSVKLLEERSEAGWVDLSAEVQAPSNEDQVWILRNGGGGYRRLED